MTSKRKECFVYIQLPETLETGFRAKTSQLQAEHEQIEPFRLFGLRLEL